MGQLIVSLHRNLEEIRASLNADGGKAANAPEGLLLQSTLDRAEASLRAQAREYIAAVKSQDDGGPPAPQQPRGLPAPPLAQPRAFAPAPPIPAMGMMGRSGSVTKTGKRPLQAPGHGTRARSKTTSSTRLLPRGNRLDPLADPPTLTENDLHHGLLSLAERGFIPQNVDVSPAMARGVPVVTQKPAPLYDQAHKSMRRNIAPADDRVLYKLDNGGPSPFAPASMLDVVERARQLETSPRVQPQPQLAPQRKQLPPLQSAQPLPALPAPPPPEGPMFSASPSHAGGFGTFCTEIPTDEVPMGQSSMALVPAQPAARNDRKSMEVRMRNEAATSVQARWRGAMQRKKYRRQVQHALAARKIQRAWAACLTRAFSKLQLHERQEEERKKHVQLMYRLGEDWWQTKQMRRIEVHVCSLTIPDSRRARMENFQAMQAAQMSRIFRLLDQKRDVILVAHKHIHEDMLEYYAKIMQFRGVRNPQGRFQVVVPEHMGLNPYLSITQGLLCSPKAMRRIKKLVAGRQGMIIPDVVSQAELKLSAHLELPLLGAGPRNMALLSSKSNMKKLAQLAELPVGPWAVDIYDEDEFFTSLTGLVVKNPSIRTWLFKIDDERDSRGHAYIDLAKMREVTDVLRLLVQSRSEQGAEAGSLGDSFDSGGALVPLASGMRCEADPTASGSLASEIRALLQRLVPKRVSLSNRRVYPDFAAWMVEVSRVGAVIQAVPENLLAQTSVHLQLDPDGATTVLGTSEAAMCSPFVRAASWYPHTRGSWEVLQETGVRMGRVLAAKGLVGFASVDVVFHENPGFDPASLEEDDRVATPMVIGGTTPVDPGSLMFEGLRSPSPEMSSSSRANSTPELPPPMSESRLADYDLAVQLRSAQAEPRARDPVSMMLGKRGGQVGASSNSRWACWVVDVDTRLTDEAAAMFPLQFIAQVRFDTSSGTIRLAPEAQAEESSKQQQQQPDDHDKMQRWALISHMALAPCFEKTNYQTVFQQAKMKGISFDLYNNIGCMFTHLDIVNSFFSLLAVERTAELCAKRLTTALAGLLGYGDGGSKRASGGRTKLVAPRDAPLPAIAANGQEVECHDSLTITDVQIALRSTLRRWADKAK